MNLQQVFDKLEALYMNPQAELHEVSLYDEGITVRGAKDVFTNAGVIVLSNQNVPDGKKYKTVCQKCDKDMESVFDPKEKYILYCEKCYQQEVF